MIELFRRLFAPSAEALKTGGRRRSPRWRAVRAAHLLVEPACAACGTRERLEVHHVLPFCLRPELELDPANLLTLCEGPSRNCHFTFAHLYNWASFNPLIREDAAEFLRKLRESREGGKGHDGSGAGTVDCN